MDDSPVDGGGDAPAPLPSHSPAPPPERDTAFLVSAGIALVAMFVLARNLLPAKQDLADTNRKIESLKTERDALAKERELLEMKEKALKGDPAYIERTLRGQTGMSKPGEFIVK